MKPALPPLAWFRAFEAAARHLSFTRAAEDIGMTQPAISQQVRSLEMRLGVELFVRQARGLKLTDQGRRLLPQVDSALKTLTLATESFDTGARESLLTVAASVSITQWVFAPVLDRFTGSNPSLRVRFLSTIWSDELNAALEDVSIRFGSARQVGAKAVRLTPDRLIAVKAPFAVGDITALPLIETVGVSDGWKAWADHAACRLQPPGFFVDSYGMAMNLAVQGHGVALVSTLLAHEALQAGTLILAHAASIQGNEGFFLSINPETPQAALFRDWVLDHLARRPALPGLER